MERMTHISEILKSSFFADWGIIKNRKVVKDIA